MSEPADSSWFTKVHRPRGAPPSAAWVKGLPDPDPAPVPNPWPWKPQPVDSEFPEDLVCSCGWTDDEYDLDSIDLDLLWAEYGLTWGYEPPTETYEERARREAREEEVHKMIEEAELRAQKKPSQKARKEAMRRAKEEAVRRKADAEANFYTNAAPSQFKRSAPEPDGVYIFSRPSTHGSHLSQPGLSSRFNVRPNDRSRSIALRAEEHRKELEKKAPALTPGSLSDIGAWYKVKEDVTEYINSRDVAEAITALEALPTKHRHLFVSRLANDALDGGENVVVLAEKLFEAARTHGLLTPENFESSLLSIIQFADDISIDVPKTYEWLARFILAAGFDRYKTKELASKIEVEGEPFIHPREQLLKEFDKAQSTLGYMSSRERLEEDRRLKEEDERKVKEKEKLKSMKDFERQERAKAKAQAKKESKRREKEEREAQIKAEAEARAREAAEVKAKQEAERKAREEEERKAKEEEDRRLKEKAERKARAREEARERREARRKEKEERDARLKSEAEAKAREEAKVRAEQEAERKAREEQERRAREEQERRLREETRAKARAEEEARAKEAERLAKEEAERKAKEEEARVKAETGAKAREAAATKARLEAEQKAREEEEHRIREEERQAREEERRLQEEAEQRVREAEEARLKAEAEAKAKAEEEARQKEEAERKAKEEAERKAKEEEEARLKAEAEAKAKEEAEAKAKAAAEPAAQADEDSQTRDTTSPLPSPKQTNNLLRSIVPNGPSPPPPSTESPSADSDVNATPGQFRPPSPSPSNPEPRERDTTYPSGSHDGDHRSIGPLGLEDTSAGSQSLPTTHSAPPSETEDEALPATNLLEPVMPLKVTEHRWVGGSMQSAQQKIQDLLNKLTVDNFDSISHRIIRYANRSEQVSDGSMLMQVVKLVLASARNDPMYAGMYAGLCRNMTESLSPNIQDETMQDWDEQLMTGGPLFRKYLFALCQAEFQRGWNVKGTELTAESRAKRQGLGLVRFMAELFRLQMLTERTMHGCIKKLLSSPTDPKEEDIESLCELLTTIGQTLDTPKARGQMNTYFERMKEMRSRGDLNWRIRFMLLDVIELRARHWQNRSSVSLIPGRSYDGGENSIAGQYE